jgi:hypothetical protein
MVPVANKRLQLCKAIPEVKTDIMVFANGDITWPFIIIPWLLAPFENSEIGGVRTSQRVRRLKTRPYICRIFNWLGTVYIKQHNFEILVTHMINSSTLYMSGRTLAVLTKIMKVDAFLSGFQGEMWGGNLLKANNNNFVTQWLVANNWRTWV